MTTHNSSRVTQMIDENLARLRAHRNNIYRYRSLLNSRLSDLERAFLRRRLSEEQSSIDALTDSDPRLA